MRLLLVGGYHLAHDKYMLDQMHWHYLCFIIIGPSSSFEPLFFLFCRMFVERISHSCQQVMSSLEQLLGWGEMVVWLILVCHMVWLDQKVIMLPKKIYILGLHLMTKKALTRCLHLVWVMGKFELIDITYYCRNKLHTFEHRFEL